MFPGGTLMPRLILHFLAGQQKQARPFQIRRGSWRDCKGNQKGGRQITCLGRQGKRRQGETRSSGSRVVGLKQGSDLISPLWGIGKKSGRSLSCQDHPLFLWFCEFLVQRKIRLGFLSRTLDNRIFSAKFRRPESWPSGWRRSPAKGVRANALRGFESLTLRHFSRLIYWYYWILFL